jgi:Flp pilus assembly protein TadD
MAPEVSPEAVQAQLERILASKGLIHSERLSRFLKFVVVETLAGRGDQLKEQVLGWEVFGRGESFDPRIDTVVRVEAHRLRAKLKQYYAAAGREDAVLIELPKGSYAPAFSRRTAPRRAAWRRWMPLALAAVVAAGLLAGWALTRSRRERAPDTPAVNPNAHQAYLRARYQWNKRTEDGLKKSIEHYHQALAADASYAPAYAGLAEAYAMLASYGVTAPREVMPKARAAAKRALEADPSLAEAYAVLGFVRSFYDWDWKGAGQDYRRALELKPDSATARHWYAGYLRAVGRFDAALEEIRRAQALDPLSRAIHRDLARTLYSMGRHDQAIEEYRKALEFEPDFPSGHLHLGMALMAKSAPEPALASFLKARELPGGNPLILGGLGYCYGVLGRTAEAREVLKELEAWSRRAYVSAVSRALVYIGLGDRDSAFRWLDTACQERDVWLAWLKVDPVFDRLRGDPRLAGLLRTVRLEAR